MASIFRERRDPLFSVSRTIFPQHDGVNTLSIQVDDGWNPTVRVSMVRKWGMSRTRRDFGELGLKETGLAMSKIAARQLDRKLGRYSFAARNLAWSMDNGALVCEPKGALDVILDPADARWFASQLLRACTKALASRLALLPIKVVFRAL